MISISDYYRKWRGYFAFSLLLCISLSSESCGPKTNNDAKDTTETTSADTLPSDFVAFFTRFHEDSTYQLEHITFPLQGLPPSTGDGDTATHARYFWQKEDWVKHNPFTDPGSNFDHWYEVINDRVIEHWIQMKGTNMFMWRRFAKLDDGWYLIYYQGMRPMDRK